MTTLFSSKWDAANSVPGEPGHNEPLEDDGGNWGYAYIEDQYRTTGSDLVRVSGSEVAIGNGGPSGPPSAPNTTYYVRLKMTPDSNVFGMYLMPDSGTPEYFIDSYDDLYMGIWAYFEDGFEFVDSVKFLDFRTSDFATPPGNGHLALFGFQHHAEGCGSKGTGEYNDDNSANEDDIVGTGNWPSKHNLMLYRYFYAAGEIGSEVHWNWWNATVLEQNIDVNGNAISSEGYTVSTPPRTLIESGKWMAFIVRAKIHTTDGIYQAWIKSGTDSLKKVMDWNRNTAWDTPNVPHNFYTLNGTGAIDNVAIFGAWNPTFTGTKYVWLSNFIVATTYDEVADYLGLTGESASVSPSSSPSLSPSASVSPSVSPSLSPSASISPSVSPSVSPSISPSGSPSMSASESPSESPSISPSVSPSLSPSASISPSISPSTSPSKSPSASPSAWLENPRFILVDSPYIIAGGEVTTAQLTAPDGKVFQAGRIQDDENPTDGIDLTVNKYTEIEWCIKATDDAEVDATYQFRVTKWDISDIRGCALWLRSDLGVTHDGDPTYRVSNWEDQALSNDFSQNTSGNKPVWYSGSPSYILYDYLDDYLTDGNDSSIQLAGLPQTHCYWVKDLNLSSGGNAFLEEYVDDNNYTLMAIYLTSIFFMSVLGGVAKSGISTGTFGDLTSWTNLIVTFDGTIYAFYVNGELVSHTPGSTSSPNRNVGFHFGRAGSNWACLGGKVDQIALYNRDLTNGEVTKFYNNTKTRYGL